MTQKEHKNLLKKASSVGLRAYLAAAMLHLLLLRRKLQRCVTAPQAWKVKRGALAVTVSAKERKANAVAVMVVAVSAVVEVAMIVVASVAVIALNALEIAQSAAVNAVSVLQLKAVKVVAVAEVATSVGVIVRHVKMLLKTEHLAQILCWPTRRIQAKMARKMKRQISAHHAKPAKAVVVSEVVVDVVNVLSAVIAPIFALRTSMASMARPPWPLVE
jgi:hypothetical protein